MNPLQTLGPRMSCFRATFPRKLRLLLPKRPATPPFEEQKEKPVNSRRSPAGHGPTQMSPLQALLTETQIGNGTDDMATSTAKRASLNVPIPAFYKQFSGSTSTRKDFKTQRPER
ncbi:hypothetical protein MPH_10226 [Macrophomina phaseolina MS6]|uniref:Uncharacterized protein n=1 Tax=Macrophomina phaseolina (strain MS6) TaxID=1126212 RepID=K2RIG1_MACPH|nr:hypothetical protein MPH_10226 [Macrophomina phaseolina MS6]